MKISVLISCLISLSTLSACSSSSNPAEGENSEPQTTTSLANIVGPLDSVQRMGWVFITENRSAQRVTTFGTFFEIGEEQGYINEYISTQPDTCIVELLDTDAPLIEDRLLNEYVSVSAGETLALTSSAGSYAELMRLELQSGIGYIPLSDQAYPSPQQLTVAAPGDIFSAASIAIEKPSATEGLSLTVGDEVSAETTISWTASVSNDTLVYAYFADLSVPDLYIECLLADDGEFTLPASVQTQADTLVNGTATIIFDGSSRIRAVSKRENDDLFVVVRSSS